MIHRGEIVEQAIRNSGIPLTTIAKRMGKTRQWLYFVFDNPNVPLDIVIEIGKIIYYDFTQEIASLSTLPQVNDDQSTYQKLDANYWKEKYFQLMEEHLALIKKTQENKNNE